MKWIFVCDSSGDLPHTNLLLDCASPRWALELQVNDGRLDKFSIRKSVQLNWIDTPCWNLFDKLHQRNKSFPLDQSTRGERTGGCIWRLREIFTCSLIIPVAESNTSGSDDKCEENDSLYRNWFRASFVKMWLRNLIVLSRLKCFMTCRSGGGALAQTINHYNSRASAAKNVIPTRVIIDIDHIISYK